MRKQTWALVPGGRLIQARQIAKQGVLLALRAYKWLLSPLLPAACRFLPTCSEYAMEAVERHGVLRGGAMAAWRVLRCHPLARGGYDPIANDQRPTTND